MGTADTKAPRNRTRTLLAALGPLRILLVIAAVVWMLAVPDPGTRAVFHGVGAITTVVVPAIAPILLMVVLLDLTMSTVFMVDKRGRERTRYRNIALLHAVLAAGMVIAWYPFFRSIMGGSG